MELKLICSTLIVCFIGISEQRGSIQKGDLDAGYPINFEIHDKVGIPWMKRDEDFEVETVGKERIVAVHVADLTGYGESSITDGGVGGSFVKIHLAGPRGEGYRFLVEVRADKIGFDK